MRTTTCLLALWVLAACGAPSSTQDAGSDAGQAYVPTQQRALGLNDVTFLLPREPLSATSAFPLVSAMVPRFLFDRVSTTPGDVLTDFDRLRVVAVRFDACDRVATGDCPDDATGSLRLVLQPVFPTGFGVEDVTLHAFFPIPRREVPVVVDELRALAVQQGVALTAPLQVAAAFTSNMEFRAALGALVARYAKGDQLLRLTLFGQLTMHAALIWVFRGQERVPGTGSFRSIQIPAIAMTDQQVLLFGGLSYQVTPVADVPAGLAVGVYDSSFRAASPSQQRGALEALAAVDNPLLHTADTVQCVSCHVATNVLEVRAADAGVAVTSLTSRFTSSRFDLTPLGDPNRRSFTLRALGYLGETPLVSQRVVNESVNVVEELERRFPAAP